MSWEKIWDSITNWFATSGMQLLKAILALIIGIIFVKLIIGVLKKILNK